MGLISKKKYLIVVLLLLSVLSLTLVFRYPLTPHERLVDSFFIQGLGKSISDYGYAKWTIHPLSYFGLYPYSYPSALPFMLSEMSQFTGLDWESSVLVLSLMYGILCALFMFLLVKQVTGDWRAGLAGGLFYTIAPSILSISIWNTSTRNLFLVLLPLVLLAFIKFHYTQKTHKWSVPYLIVVILLSFTLVCSHRLGIFIVPIIVAYIIALLFEKIPITDLLKTTVERRKVMKYITGITITIIVVGIIIVQYIDVIDFYARIQWDLRRSYPNETSLIGYFYNMGKSYTQSIGLGIIFLAVGFVAVSFGSKKQFHDIFILLCFFASLLILIVMTYGVDWIIPLASIFIGIGFIKVVSIIWKKRRALGAVAAVALIVASCISTQLVLNYWANNESRMKTDSRDWLDDNTYCGIVYAIYLPEKGCFIGTIGDTTFRLSGFGLSSLPSPDAMALVHGSVNGDMLDVEPISLDDFLKGNVVLYNAKVSYYDMPERAWYSLTTAYTYSKYQKIKNIYDIEYLFENSEMNGQILYKGKMIPSGLLQQTYLTKYKIFQSGNIAIWKL